jgi:hypothetical protein
MPSYPYSRAELVARLRRMRLQPVISAGVRKLGYDPPARMAGVVFRDSAVAYGYPNLSDEEVSGLLEVMESDGSLGHYIATVVKPNHDFEHVRSDEATLRLVT